MSGRRGGGLTSFGYRHPRHVGKPLRRELVGRYSARRGTFRIIYRIDDADHLITVLRVEHRADVYRRL